MASSAPKLFRVNPKRSLIVELVLGVLAGAPLVMLGFFLFHYEMIGELLKTPVVAAAVVFLPVGLVLALWSQRRFSARARLTLDEEGLHVRSGLPAFVGASWDCRWNEIAQVSVIDPFGMVRIRRRRFGSAPLVLRVADWMEDRPGAQPGPISPRAMRTTALWKALEEAGLFKDQPRDEAAEAVNFDLARHPATRAALIVMSVLTAYWAIDAFIAREAWAEWRARYVVPHIMVGVAAAVVGSLALKWAARKRPIPDKVVAVLAMTLGMASGVASWCGLIRVNQLLGGPLEEHAYVRNQKCDTLLPVESGLPPIEYTGLAKSYWCQFPIDQQHAVLVRKGLGGLYQVDLTRHTQAIREFRSKGQ